MSRKGSTGSTTSTMSVGSTTTQEKDDPIMDAILLEDKWSRMKPEEAAKLSKAAIKQQYTEAKSAIKKWSPPGGVDDESIKKKGEALEALSKAYARVEDLTTLEGGRRKTRRHRKSRRKTRHRR